MRDGVHEWLPISSFRSWLWLGVERKTLPVSPTQKRTIKAPKPLADHDLSVWCRNCFVGALRTGEHQKEIPRFQATGRNPPGLIFGRSHRECIFLPFRRQSSSGTGVHARDPRMTVYLLIATRMRDLYLMCRGVRVPAGGDATPRMTGTRLDFLFCHADVTVATRHQKYKQW